MKSPALASFRSQTAPTLDSYIDVSHSASLLTHSHMDSCKMTASPSNRQVHRSRLSILVAERIDALKGQKNLFKITREMGYLSPDTTAGFASGTFKVPIDKVVPLAKALDVDPHELFVLALEQFWPDTESMMREMFPRNVSVNEFEIIELVRGATDGCDPKLTPSQKAALSGILSRREYQ